MKTFLLVFLTISVLISCGRINSKDAESTPAETKTEIIDSLKSDDTKEFSDAVVYGKTETVLKMIQENPEIVNSKGELGFSALHNAMCDEQFETVELIIRNGANVNIQNDDGIAPLHLACYVKNAELLLEGGADINLRDFYGSTPLHSFAENGDESYYVAKFLLRKGADRNLKNKAGETPLSIARSREDTRMIRLFEK